MKKNKALYTFLIKAFLFYIAWNLVYFSWVNTDTSLEMWLTSKTAWATTELFTLTGSDFAYRDKPGERGDQSYSILLLDGRPILSIADNCNALTLIVLFAGFILAYPGRWLHRAWFIPLGALLIFIINVIRASSLVWIFLNFSQSIFDFHHKYTFTIAVYLCVFAMWMLWANKLGGSHKTKTLQPKSRTLTT